MAAEGCRAATLDRGHDLQLAEADVAGVGRAPSGAVVAEDIRDLQSWTGHDGRLLLRRLVRPGRSGVSRSSGLITARIVLVATRV